MVSVDVTAVALLLSVTPRQYIEVPLDDNTFPAVPGPYVEPLLVVGAFNI